MEQYNAEARWLCNYYNLACDYHTLDYFCYLMEYSCLKTIANKHKTSIRKIIRQYKDGKTWSVPYETKTGTKRVRPVKIADCKRGEASDIIYQRKKFSWKPLSDSGSMPEFVNYVGVKKPICMRFTLYGT